jgi:hypothetical protein
VPSRAPIAERFEAIRSWDGSKYRAFEELCYQLRDPAPNGAELFKTGDPDAGLEWYWRHADDSETGWQAKYIFNIKGLLKAMRESLKSAVEKRPGLRKMTFCIPYDLADDPSNSNGTQATQRFEEAKTRWLDFAPDVEIGLLSGGQLLERLALEEHRGREWFFFRERVLGGIWCKAELEGTIEDAGDRYTPQQDVDLPIDHILESLSQPQALEDEIQARLEAVLRAARDLLKDRERKERWSEELGSLRRELGKLEAEPLTGREPPSLRTAPALALIDAALGRLDSLVEALRPVAWAPKSDERRYDMTSEAGRAASAEQERLRASAQNLYEQSNKVSRALRKLSSFLSGAACQAAERGALFVEGPAGRGKTHLFCDVGERLAAAGHPVLVLLGQRFHEGSVWGTLASLLGEPALGPDEVASVFAASGEASGRKAILMIDAINETRPDPGIWAAELSDLRRRLTATGWVAFAASCRDTYLDLVEAPGGRDPHFVRVEHLGYRGREFEAVEKIFALHGLAPPRVPLLLPEFSDPLFLKLYCEGLEGHEAPPSGSEHLSDVFESFIATRGDRVEATLRLDRRLETVRQAVAALARRLAQSGGERIGYAEAARLINEFADHLRTSPNTLIEQMASEGLIAVDRSWIAERGEMGEVVGFPYQRFSDHLLVSAIFAEHLAGDEPEDVAAAFSAGGSMENWLTEAPRGLLEAIAVQLPERWSIEFPDLVPEERDESRGWSHRANFVLPEFVTSLLARDRAAFGERTTELLNECLDSIPEETIDALISFAPDPDHPYNGDRLHRFLEGMPMAERDRYWGKLTYDSFGDPGSALDRLIRWAARGPYDSYPDEVVALACIPIVWVLSSPNRFARDYATKALASVLVGRVEVCRGLVARFALVDDPYVTQRLAAAVAGSITRSSSEGLDGPELKGLLEDLVTHLVEADAALPDILTRDYIASLARHLRRARLIPPRLLKRAQPPYGSKPPKIPRRAAYLEETYPEREEADESYGSLHFSALLSHSDWNRYEVHGRIGDFLRVRLGEPVPEKKPRDPAEDLRLDKRAWARFAASLTPEQKRLLETEEDQPEEEALVDTLDSEQRELLVKVFVPRRRQRVAALDPAAMPAERATRLIFQRCIELGWTPESFGEFDRMVARRNRGREAHKAERFGKKYQWIALHELLARLGDNFTMKAWEGAKTYTGAWQLNLRDLDPTIPPEKIVVDNDQEHSRSPTFASDRRPVWWSRGLPAFEGFPSGQAGDWADREDDLPTPEDLLVVSDEDERRWVIVDGFHTWRFDSDDQASMEAVSQPMLDLSIRSFGAIIRRNQLDTLRDWLANEPDLLRAIPDWMSHPIHGAFWAELPDEGPSHEYPAGWRPAPGKGGLPVRSAAASLGYAAEDGGSDCSLSAGVSVDLPSRFLHGLLGAAWDERRAMWVDEDGDPLAQYRQTDDGFHRDRALLVSEAALVDALSKNGLLLAIGLFSERRAFDRSQMSDTNLLGWTDRAGHLILGGDRIVASGPLTAIKRH